MSDTASNPKWSEVLHRAADFHLESDADSFDERRSTFTCDCIRHAAKSITGSMESGDRIVSDLATFAGLNTGMRAFIEFPEGQERQSVRYAWLKMAAMYYEEQGN
jgi:hypothetical protein